MSRRTRDSRHQITVKQLFNDLRADYKIQGSAERWRRERKGLPIGGAAADWHIAQQNKYFEGVEIARDIVRNDSIVGQGLRRAVDNIIQRGLSLDVDTGDKELDRDLAARWKEWASDPRLCHSAKKLSFVQLERLALLTVFRDGEIACLPLRDGRLQPLEAHRIRTPNRSRRKTHPIINGVEIDSLGAPRRYYVTKRERGTRSDIMFRDVEPKSAFDDEGEPAFFHVFDPDSVSQSRGVSRIAPIVDVVTMAEDIFIATAVQKQISTAWAVIREREFELNPTAPVSGFGDEEEDDEEPGETAWGVQPGMELTGDPGEKIRLDSAKVPNTEFFQHVKALQTVVAINLGMPHAVFVLDPSLTNFSGWRGAIEQARFSFRWHQTWLPQAFHSPIYRWQVRRWMRGDKALRAAADRGGINIFGHQWNPAGWPYIEPSKDAKTDVVRLVNGLGSPRSVYAERGKLLETHMIHTLEDRMEAIQMAKKALAEKTGEAVTWDDVPWQALVPIPMPAINETILPATEVVAQEGGTDGN